MRGLSRSIPGLPRREIRYVSRKSVENKWIKLSMRSASTCCTRSKAKWCNAHFLVQVVGTYAGTRDVFGGLHYALCGPLRLVIIQPSSRRPLGHYYYQVHFFGLPLLSRNPSRVLRLCRTQPRLTEIENYKCVLPKNNPRHQCLEAVLHPLYFLQLIALPVSGFFMLFSNVLFLFIWPIKAELRRTADRTKNFSVVSYSTDVSGN